MMLFHRYLREFGNKNVHAYTETPHSWYNQMLGKNFWQVLESSPERVATFNKCLQLFASIHTVVALFPFETALKEGNKPDRPLLVDIGGGNGQAVMEIRKGCPTLQGDLVLQDRPDVIDSIKAEDLPGITKMAHDFFTEQPVKNAQVYYIRRVMHDWQDEDAAKIMKAIMPAMAPDSRILISDMKIPEPASLRDAAAVWLDVMVMAIGGKERTRRDWDTLAELTGLKLVKIWQEPETYGTLCIVEYMLKDAKSESKDAEVAVRVVEHANKDADSIELKVESQQEIKERPVAKGIAAPEEESLANGVERMNVAGENDAKV